MYAFQLANGMIYGDASSNQVFEIDARLRAWGYQTGIFSRYIAPELEGRVTPAQACIEHLNRPDNLFIYHYGLYDPNYHWFQKAQGKRVLIYHNITPAHYFRRWDMRLEMHCALGRGVLKELIDGDLLLGDSEYNRQELIQVGAMPEKTGVLPIFLTHVDTSSVDNKLLQQLKRVNKANWLTVGRVAPSKGLEDLLRLFYVYNQSVNPESMLYIVGSQSIPRYTAALKRLVETLALAESVVFTGRVSDKALRTYYQAADLYVTTSYHEGFGVPFIESMHFGVPILARKTSAVPDVLGDAGVMFSYLGYEQVAEMAHLLISDDTLRAQVIRKQRERLQLLGPEYAESALKRALQRIGMPNGD